MLMEAFLYIFLVLLSLVSPPLLCDASANSNVREYEDAIVLLVDAPSGMLGVEIEDPQKHTKRKLSFIVNPVTVYVTNQINQNLEFSNIKPGDRADLVVSTDKDGKEIVTDITDYDQFERD